MTRYSSRGSIVTSMRLGSTAHTANDTHAQPSSLEDALRSYSAGSGVRSGKWRVVRVAGREVTITNRDKVFFPRLGLTKGDLVDYYVDLAPTAC